MHLQVRIAATDMSTIDGTGIAYVVFFQGCSLKCKGCQNESLQDHTGGIITTTDKALEDLFKYEDFYESVVFLGGEPLEQQKPLIDMLEKIREKTDKITWLYTGWDFSKIPYNIVKLVDVIVAGAYIEELHQDGFPASKNQKIYYRGELVGDNFDIRKRVRRII